MIDVVLAHSGVTDAGEWDDVAPHLAREHRVVTVDLWRAGSIAKLVLDAIPGERAALVGTSFGGRGVLEAASASPERVSAIVIIGTNPFGWSEAVREVAQEENALCEAGRFDDAARLMVRAWLVGARRSEEDVPAELRERVFAMQRAAYELPQGEGGPLDVGAVRAPLLYIRGELDWPDVQRAAERFPNAQHAVVAGAAHLPAMERPAEVARLILDFLAQVQ